jgi:hypothetical protein
MDTETRLPEDVYSKMLARVIDHPEATTLAASTIDLVTLLGHTQTWIVKVVRIAGRDTAFLQRIDAEGGMRLVLPPEVTAAYRHQADRLDAIGRRRAARKAAATRREKKGVK